MEAGNEGVFTLLLITGTAGIEAVEGTDHCLFGEDAGHYADRGLPVVIAHTYGVQHRGDRLTDLAQHRALLILVAKAAISPQRVEYAQHSNHQHYGFTGTEHEGFEFLPGLKYHVDGARPLVIGHLHQHGITLARQQSAAQQEAGEHGHQNADEIETEHQVLTRFGKKATANRA